MNNIKIKPLKSIEKINTTITIKKGTKYQLDDIAKKGESYDDVIAKLLHESEILKAKNKSYEKRLKELNALNITKKQYRLMMNSRSCFHTINPIYQLATSIEWI